MENKSFGRVNAWDTKTTAVRRDGQLEPHVLQVELEAILATKSIRTVFQPVVSLRDGSVVGYEALSRGPHDSPLEMPADLFAVAEKFDRVWELEFLCRSVALDNAGRMDGHTMLFLNVDPQIIHDPRFQKGATMDMLAQCHISAANIVFEITERTAIENYEDFRKTLDNYISQGYKIAVDDAGSGYSGLKLLAEIKPQFIKIDMDLVRNIDKDPIKQALMKAFYDFSVVANMTLIAEGIENMEELGSLIEIGIPFGQGYFLQQPVAEFSEVVPAVRAYITGKHEQKQREAFNTPLTAPVGEFARQDEAFPGHVAGGQALEYFNANPVAAGIAIVRDGKPIGLLMKNRFLSHLATKYGMSIYMNRPVNLIMDDNPLIVDYGTPLEQVSKFAVSRTDSNLYDYIIITRNGQYYGITTVKSLLEKTTQLELNRARHSNPLSGLPGNVLIETKLQQTLNGDGDYAVLYFDLDNFKAYNDSYGFENGDKVLCMTSHILQTNIRDLNLQAAFLGHIGGDDFIAVLPTLDIERLCRGIIDAFDDRIRDFYSECDHRRGYIIGKNRHGAEENFPIISLSIAVVTNRNQRHSTPAAVAEAAVAVKKQCKLTWHSCFHVS